MKFPLKDKYFCTDDTLKGFRYIETDFFLARFSGLAHEIHFWASDILITIR